MSEGRNFSEILEEHLAVVGALAECAQVIEAIAAKMTQCLRSGGKICFMGNGGSAADSQHLAAEFVGRFQMERGALSAIALTTDTSVLTAVANDYGFEAVFERQVEALVEARDVVVGISTSGNSPNVLRAIARAREIGAVTVGLTGESGGALKEGCELCLRVASAKAARIQEGHILVGHSLCEIVETALV
ncbi:MAG: SIS domain-containing protein [Verrucomicrobiales bacterium]